MALSLSNVVRLNKQTKILDDWTKSSDAEKCVDIIIMDIRKHTTSHHMLLFKLKSLRFSEGLYKLIKTYLNNRKQHKFYWYKTRMT